MGNSLSTNSSLPLSTSANWPQSSSYTYQPCSPYVVSYTSSLPSTVRPGRGSTLCRSPRTMPSENSYHYYCCSYGSDNNLPNFCGVASSTWNNMDNAVVTGDFNGNNRKAKKYLNADEAISDGDALKRAGKVKSAIEAFQAALIMINHKYNFHRNSGRKKINENTSKNFVLHDTNGDVYEDVPLNTSSPFGDKHLFSSSMTPLSPSSAHFTAATASPDIASPVFSSSAPLQPAIPAEVSPRNSGNTTSRSMQASCPSTAYPPSEASSRLSSTEMPSEGTTGKIGSISSCPLKFRHTETGAMMAEKYTRVLDMLGELYVCEKEYEHAIHCYNMCIHLYNNNTCLNDSDDENNCNAEGYSEKITYNNHYVCTYHYKKGVVLQMLRSFEDASECFRKALKINPDYAPALFNLGVVKVNGNTNGGSRNKKNYSIGVDSADINEAITVFKHLLSLDNNNYNNTEVMILLSNCYEYLGEFEEALSYLYMARGIDKSNYSITRDIQRIEPYIR